MPRNLSRTLRIHSKTKPFFRAALQSDGTLELLIYEDIGANWWDGGGITAKTVKQQIDEAANYSKILIRINSPGGDAFEGIAIYNVVRSQKKPVEVRVDGIAASSASIVAMAGDDIIMGPNALMMIHNAWSWCMGYASDMRKMAEALDKISGALAQTYVTKTKKDLDAVLALMDAETWMTAQECLDGGFATAIASESEEAQPAALAMARNFASLKALKKLPDALKPQGGVACTCDCDNCVAGACENCDNEDCTDLNCIDCPMQEAAGTGAGAAAAIRPAAAPAAPVMPVAASADREGYERLLARMDRDRLRCAGT